MIMTPMDDEFFQHAFDPYVAGRCLLVVSVVQGECLLERKKMLGAVAPGEGRGPTTQSSNRSPPAPGTEISSAETGRKKPAQQLARISHRVKRIGAPNQRKLFCENDFLMIRGEPR